MISGWNLIYNGFSTVLISYLVLLYPLCWGYKSIIGYRWFCTRSAKSVLEGAGEVSVGDGGLKFIGGEVYSFCYGHSRMYA